MSNTSTPRSLLLSGLLGGLFATTSLTMLGAPPPPAAQTSPGWPPHPKRIVQFVEELELAVAPDDFFDVMTVPEGQTLVVESLVITSPETSVFTLCGFEPYEELDGARTIKGVCNGTGGVGSGTGAVFRPGSKIVAQNVTGLTTTVITVSMVGYYSPAR